MSFLGLVLLTATVLLPLASADFSYPPQGAVFHIGEKETIKWQTTLANYTVALWQQALAGGSATLGPIVLRTLVRSPCATTVERWRAKH